MTKSITQRAWARTALAAAALAVVSGFAAPAQAQTLDTVRIASAMSLPLFVTSAPGEPYFIYILLKGGRIVRHDLRTNTQADFIDLNSIVINPTGVSDERGLLGLAFHPGYQTNGYFYVYYTSNAGRQILARYSRTSPGVGNAASASIVLDMADPFSNHNGGWMAFAPGDTQGHLYVSTGDGGSGNDPNNAGQNLATLLGKMLRIDVDGPDNIPANTDDDGYPADTTINTAIPTTNPFVGGANTTDDLIWAYGLRNAWRCSFDRATGALYIGDVGQSAFEEHNFQPAASAGGQNYGWRCYEANQNTGLCGSLPSGVTFPFFNYGRSLGISTTAGYVYRGCAIPSLRGTYLLGDFGTARVWAVSGASASAAPTGTPTEIQADLSPPIGGGAIASIASFGEDAFGEMYIVRHSASSGEVFRIIPQGGIVDCNANNVSDCGEISLGLVADCNSNAIIDSCEIASNAALDCNVNGALDSCEIAANAALDCDVNGALDSCQIAANAALDCDGNGALDSCQIAAAPALDCNNNGILDDCDITSGFSQDTNKNNIPDECEACPGDANGDNAVNFDDVTAVLGNFGGVYEPGSGGLGDANNDGSVNFDDVTAVLGNFGIICN
jgi:glucose/arabinose dehydrogenase